jgi:hypothetical protein
MIDPQGDAMASSGNGPAHREDAEGFSELLSPTVKEALSEQENQMRALIRAHPVTAVVGALALGFLAARFLRETVSG